jgi:hypothetical protein
MFDSRSCYVSAHYTDRNKSKQVGGLRGIVLAYSFDPFSPGTWQFVALKASRHIRELVSLFLELRNMAFEIFLDKGAIES